MQEACALGQTRHLRAREAGEATAAVGAVWAAPADGNKGAPSASASSSSCSSSSAAAAEAEAWHPLCLRGLAPTATPPVLLGACARAGLRLGCGRGGGFGFGGERRCEAAAAAAAADTAADTAAVAARRQPPLPALASRAARAPLLRMLTPLGAPSRDRTPAALRLRRALRRALRRCRRAPHGVGLTARDRVLRRRAHRRRRHAVPARRRRRRAARDRLGLALARGEARHVLLDALQRLRG